MQKYVIVQFLDNVKPRFEFAGTNWPLHLTMVANFAVTARSDEIVANLKKIVSSQPCFTVTAGPDELFGANKDVLVTTMIMNDKIINLHNNMVAMLQKMDAVFDEPGYNKQGFRAHVTAQLSHRVDVGDDITINSLSLVDMFPNGDIGRRRVIETVMLTN